MASRLRSGSWSGRNPPLPSLLVAFTDAICVAAAAGAALLRGAQKQQGLGPAIQGFIAGDGIDLKGIASAGLGPPAYNSASDDLQITGSGGNAIATLAFQNSSLGAGTFHAASDGAGGTLITHS
jgi:hypothetical protein